MSPVPRRVAPAAPLHITQRGVNRWPTFLEDIDLARYRLALQAASDSARCTVHAYVLMTNHVHLLITPTDVLGPARMMQSLGRCYVRYFNDRYRRTGTLWEGRFRSVPIESESHLLACYRYIELNPVRAAMVADPRAYEWSSFRCNAIGERDAIVRPHPLYSALGSGDDERRAGYRDLFSSKLEPDVIAALRAGTCGRFQPGAKSYEEAVGALNERLLAKSGKAGGEGSLPWPEFPTAHLDRDSD